MSDIAIRTRKLILEQAGETEVGLPADDVDLYRTFGFDSLDLTELQLQIEEEFGIRIDDDAAQEWETAGEVVRAVEQACAPEAA